MFETISNKVITANINQKGAELSSLISNDKQYIWEGNPKFWGKHSPVLFPIVGTLKNNSYCYNNKEYTLSRHGFAREMDFDVLNKTTNSICYQLKYSLETLKVYPFRFDFRIEYFLNDNQIIIKYTIINDDEAEMPFSIGAHPAFALSDSFDNYSIRFDVNETLNNFKLENDLISDFTSEIKLNDYNELPLSYDLFKEDAMIFKELQSKEITIFENALPFIKIDFNDFPNLGIWTKMNAPFICIEPWLGYADTENSTGDLFEKEGITILKPKQKIELQFSIEIL